uniref:Uncharacterized protein n=1 Tax=Anguilla anguilla TaxID=7936 RepID=A0A0E9TXA7_ANGAN
MILIYCSNPKELFLLNDICRPKFTCHTFNF